MIDKILRKAHKCNSNFQTESHFYSYLKSGMMVRVEKTGMESEVIAKRFQKDWEFETDWINSWENVLGSPTVGTSSVKISELMEVLPIVSRDDTRYVLGSIMFNNDKMVATDGRRLIIKTPDGEFPERTENLVPWRMLEEIVQFFGKKSELLIEFKTQPEIKKRFYIKSGGIELSGDLIDGQYPNFPQVVPKDYLNAGKFEFTENLLNKYKEVSKVYGKKVSKSFVSNENGSSFIIVPDTAKERDNWEKFEVEDSIVSEEDVPEFYVDLELLMDFIKIGMTEFWVESGKEPLSFRKDGYVGVLMPMKLN